MSMCLRSRARIGGPAGACTYTAAPPSNRATTFLRAKTSTSRRDSATGSASGALSRREEEIDVASILGEVHDSAAQHVRGIVTARIEAHCGADLLSALRLVDVPVEPNHRLVPLDDVAHGFAADWHYARSTAPDDRPQLGVELRREIQAGAIRRAVKVDHHLACFRRLVEDCLEPAGELRLRVLALGVPGRRRDVAAAGHHDWAQ